MSTVLGPAVDDAIEYPECDGKPMADNTVQYEWIVLVVGELQEVFKGRQAFVAGNLLWYPVKGDPKIRQAPDAMIALGRPPGDRGSYLQWLEDGIAPQVVFEVLSPQNSTREMTRKRKWYERYGAQEYYVIDPYGMSTIEGWIRDGQRFKAIDSMQGYVSPLMGVRFETLDGVRLYHPHGRVFRTRQEESSAMARELDEEKQKTDQAKRETEQAKRETDQAKRETDQAKRETDQAKRETDQAKREIDRLNQQAEQERLALTERLRRLGINPEDVLSPNG